MAESLLCGRDELMVDQAKRFVIDGVAVAVVLDSADVVHIIGDTCTHGDISLAEGFVEDGTLECWAHGSKFELTTGRPLTLPAFEPVPVFSAIERDGQIFTDITVKKEI